MIKIRSIRKSNEGVAGVVVGLLFVGLILSAFAFVQGVYVPQWMQDKEAEHMESVQNQLSQLKFSIDAQSALQKPYTTISNPVTLGSKEMPFLFSSRSYGTLELDPLECRMNFSEQLTDSFYEINLGALKYESDNSYYLNQVYSYETGGVILKQDSGSVMLMEPPIYVVNTQESGGNDEILFDLIRLVDKTGRKTASGFGTYPVQTKYLDTKEDYLVNVNKIQIYNTHLDAWAKFFNNTFKNQIPCNIYNTQDGRGILLDFEDITGEQSFPTVIIKITEIEVQLSQGWIE